MMQRKTLNQKEFDWLSRLDAEGDKYWDELNDWEKIFMENILETYRRYGMKTIFSKGQWNVLTRISEKTLFIGEP